MVKLNISVGDDCSSSLSCHTSLSLPGEIGEEYKKAIEQSKREFSFNRQQEIDESLKFIREMNEKWQIEDEEIANDISAKHRHLEEEDRKLALQLEKEMNGDLVINDSKVIVTRNKLRKEKENIPPSEVSLSSSEKHKMLPPRNPRTPKMRKLE